MTNVQTPNPTSVGVMRRLAPLTAVALVLTAVAQLIGDHSIDLGIGDITLYPLIWGILLGGAVSLQKVKPLPVPVQKTATHLVALSVLLLGTRLSFLVGQNIPVLLDAGPALLLQEIGHLLGTVLFSLPLAVALRMGRPTVGACFSIDREGSFAMVADRYGPDSHEYRGVLSMYVFGTLVGALYVALLASVLAGARIFDPLALAMGAGVGSGSMMAAASAAVAAEYPTQADQILALGAVSNLITTVLGLYVGMYVALPAAERFYRFLTRAQQVTEPAQAGGLDDLTAAAVGDGDPGEVQPPLVPSLALILVLFFAAATIFHGSLEPMMLVGFALMTGITVVSLWLKKLVGLSPIIGLSTIGALLASPWSPIADFVIESTASIEFLSLTTAVLVLAGLGLGKDAPLLRRIGWRIVPVGLVSLTASFVAAAAIGQVALGLG